MEETKVFMSLLEKLNQCQKNKYLTYTEYFSLQMIVIVIHSLRDIHFVDTIAADIMRKEVFSYLEEYLIEVYKSKGNVDVRPAWGELFFKPYIDRTKEENQ